MSERPGDHVAFAVYATPSSGALSYAWYKTGSPTTVLSTASTLVLTNIQSTNSGSYNVIVTDSRGSTLSGNGTLNVLPAGFLSLYASNLVVARVGDGAQPLSGATGNTVIWINTPPMAFIWIAFKSPTRASACPTARAAPAALASHLEVPAC